MTTTAVTLFALFAQSSPQQPEASPWPMLIMLGLTFFIFYFFLIRPQSQRQKEVKKMLAALKKNDKVMTNGGIIGVVVSLQDNEVVLKVDEKVGVRMTFARSAIAHVLKAANAPDEADSGRGADDEDDGESDEEASNAKKEAAGAAAGSGGSGSGSGGSGGSGGNRKKRRR